MQKKYVVIVSILIIYILITVLIFGVKKEDVSNDIYIVVGDNTNWKYVDKKWSNLDSGDDIFNDKEFSVYKNQMYQGDYYLQNYNDTWYFFDKNNQSYDLSGQLFAYSSGSKIDVIEFEEVSPTLNELANLLKEYNISITSLSEVSYVQKVLIDYDNDQQDEYIYAISNLMAENKNDDSFSIVIYIDENKSIEIIKNIGDADYIYSVSNIIDINCDEKYELIIEHKKPMNPAMNCHSMYELKKGKYELLKSCD